MGRTVISFTIKYVQSERDKLKSDVSKVLDQKNKAIKGPVAINKVIPDANATNMNRYNQNFPLHM